MILTEGALWLLGTPMLLIHVSSSEVVQETIAGKTDLTRKRDKWDDVCSSEVLPAVIR